MHEICDISNIKGMNSAQIGLDGKRVSEAEKCCRRLNEKDRSGDTKHKVKADGNNIQSYCYECTNFDDDNKMPFFKNTIYESKSGFDKGTKNGLSEMYNFYFHPGMPRDMAAVRRIPCLCEHCHERLSWDWIPDVEPKHQPMFKPKPNKTCFFKPLMGDLNKWHFVTVGPKKGAYEEEELVQVHENALVVLESYAAGKIRLSHYGAIDTIDEEAPDGVYVVQWRGRAFPLQEPATVEGCVDGPMPRGTMVARGTYLYNTKYAKGWYERNDTGPTKLFWLRHVIESDLEMEDWKKDRKEPPAVAKRYYNNDEASERMKWIQEDVRERLQIDKHCRNKLDLVEFALEREEGLEEDQEAAEEGGE